MNLGEYHKFMTKHVFKPFQKEIVSSGFELVEEKKIPGFKENYFLKFKKK